MFDTPVALAYVRCHSHAPSHATDPTRAQQPAGGGQRRRLAHSGHCHLSDLLLEIAANPGGAAPASAYPAIVMLEDDMVGGSGHAAACALVERVVFIILDWRLHKNILDVVMLENKMGRLRPCLCCGGMCCTSMLAYLQLLRPAA